MVARTCPGNDRIKRVLAHTQRILRTHVMRLSTRTITPATVVAACLFCCSIAEAKKPDKPGGGDTTVPRFTLLELPVDGGPIALSETTSGTLTVAIDASEAGYVSAAFARVNPITQELLQHGFLPEPPFADPNNGEFKNGHSGPADVNEAGTIVGQAAAYEDDPDYTGDDISPNRPIVWTYDEADESYSYELLPTLDLDDAAAWGINNLGIVVGRSSGRAVLWNPFSSTPYAIEELNTAETLALGWELLAAYDINDNGLIVGYGMLAGQRRGFLLDYVTKAIVAVPLVGPAHANPAYRINASGRVVGTAWDGGSKHYGTNPDYVQGYSWDGPGSNPVVLASVTDNTSIAYWMNDLGMSTGNSYIPTDDYLTNYTVPTLWELDEQGQSVATDLTSIGIENARGWFLARCGDVNNDGWVSVYGRKRSKGQYRWRTVLLIPNN